MNYKLYIFIVLENLQKKIKKFKNCFIRVFIYKKNDIFTL